MSTDVVAPSLEGHLARPAIGTVAAPLAVGCLLLALWDLTGGAALALGAAAGIAALGVALGPPRSRGLAFAGVNLLLLGLYLWAADEREPLELRLAGSTIEVHTAAGRIEARDVPIEGGTVAVELLDQSTRRGAQVPRQATTPELPERLLLGPQATLLAGVVPVEASGTARLDVAGEPIWQPLWGPTAPTAVGSVRPGEGSLRFELLRPGTTVRVLIGAPDRSKGVVVHVYPDNRELALQGLRDGQVGGELVGGALLYRRTLSGAAQTLGRELGRTWLWALLLLAVAVAFARLWPARMIGPRLPHPALVAALALAVLGATLLIARVILGGIPHVQDSVAYLWQAKTFASGRLWLPLPPRPEFFEHEFILQWGDRWFSKYPPGPALALLPGVLAGAPWAASPILAALTLLLVYDFGRLAYGSGTGALAALLLGVSPFFLFLSGTMMGHPFGLFLTMAALVGAARARAGGAWPAAACGLALGLLAGTRTLTALALAAPIGGWLLLSLARRPGRLVRVGAAAALGAAPTLAGWLLYNRALVGDPLGNTMTLWWAFDRPGFGPDVGMHGGHDLPRGLTNTWANLVELNRHLFGWPLYLTLAVPLVPLVAPGRPGRAWDRWLAAVVAALTGAYVFWWADGIMYGPRYFYEASGALALLSARGLAILAGGPARRPAGAGAPAGSSAFALGLAGLLLGHSLLLYLPPQLAAHRGYNGITRARLDAVEQAGLDNAVVFVTEGPTGWQGYGSVFPANSPGLDGPVVYARDLGDARNRELLRHFPDRRGYVLTGTTLRPLGSAHEEN